MMPVNLPQVVAQVEQAFADYEHALLIHDVPALDRWFWYAPQAVRYGVAEILLGGEAIRQYRQTCAPVHPSRRLQHTVVTTFGCDYATVSTEFTADDSDAIGRQMQAWVRTDAGWRIVAAHVSRMP
ncbi:oxalurate catabolism protein HpxZ [Verminephrobacter eiseniae]|uniref:oxalurate catabolism protein HpxZ n=1 Tax=Verminephrobacter eiseniae TaxID=364317 RepID=UPI0010E85D50|nr:oxalurate catabolism protein HpxZ [Verminephrobacter eiseniae]KAB7613571.1 oxalurate catabolism protein HpxZ [Verminephrobacter sp. Larva24]MCW5234403.1 oxalurate catabolism protein HpxZ [Verminephrobacter eiseniae]MCW5262595.1 oxalurate catabolism protein HpxZ [Verminephrobacter eiseniae]MCW5294021.1 oxalurate catabolism protein HpxZ [Verminephrobacter eiseniae]MCW8183241.1 oxalurate catabolism protein HpxZ [Verminephrobacter eiseniae]